MTRQGLEVMLAVLLMAGRGPAAQREVISVDWSGFQQQVSMRKLSHRTVRITLSGGGEIKTTLVGIENNGLIVKATKATNNWASGPERARIPREQVSAVRFGGRTGHRGLIGGLAGLGAGVAIPVGIGASRGHEDVPTGLAAIVIGPVSGLAGYLIGHAMDKPAPEFAIK